MVANSLRLCPAHCSVAITVETWNSSLSSDKVSFNGDCTIPVTEREYLYSLTCGTEP